MKMVYGALKKGGWVKITTLEIISEARMFISKMKMCYISLTIKSEVYEINRGHFNVINKVSNTVLWSHVQFL